MSEEMEKIYEQLETVRSSGVCNMASRRSVQSAADGLECYQLFVWIEDHSQQEYADLLNSFGRKMLNRRCT